MKLRQIFTAIKILFSNPNSETGQNYRLYMLAYGGMWKGLKEASKDPHNELSKTVLGMETINQIDWIRSHPEEFREEPKNPNT